MLSNGVLLKIIQHLSDLDKLAVLEIYPELVDQIVLEDFYEYEFYVDAPYRKAIRKVIVRGIYIPEDLFRSGVQIQCVFGGIN